MERHLQVWVAVLTALVAGVAGGAPVTVTGDNVPLRAAAEVNAESIGTVNRGTVLQTTGRTDGDWVQVQAPASAAVYVYGSLVADGAVAVNTAQVRSGPGIGYRVLGVLSRGASLDVRERVGEWLRVAPPAGAVPVWVERAHLAGRAAPPPAVPSRPTAPAPAPQEPTRAPASAPSRPAPAPTPEPVPAPRPDPTPVEPPVAVERPSRPPAPTATSTPERVTWVRPPERPLTPVQPTRPVRPLVEDDAGVTVPNAAAAAVRLDLIEGAPQGMHISVRGIVRPAGLSWFRPSPFRLVSPRGSVRVETLCYLYGPPRALSGAVGRPVRMTGRRYWVQGVRHPVVIPESFVFE